MQPCMQRVTVLCTMEIIYEKNMRAYLFARKKVKHIYKKTNLYELTILVVITIMIASFLFILFAL
jgi:hypothetical protein